jgi:hypothetical protein
VLLAEKLTLFVVLLLWTGCWRKNRWWAWGFYTRKRIKRNESTSLSMQESVDSERVNIWLGDSCAGSFERPLSC